MKLEDEIKEVEALLGSTALKLKSLQSRLTEKPKYPNDTPGYLWDDVNHKAHLVNLINTGDVDYPYTGIQLGGDYSYSNYKNFTPLETAILGMKYENKGKYPGNDKDLVMVVLMSGMESSDTAESYKWFLDGSRCSIEYYYIIKRYEG